MTMKINEKSTLEEIRAYLSSIPRSFGEYKKMICADATYVDWNKSAECAEAVRTAELEHIAVRVDSPWIVEEEERAQRRNEICAHSSKPVPSPTCRVCGGRLITNGRCPACEE